MGPEALLYEECSGRAGAGIALHFCSELGGDLGLNRHTAKSCLLCVRPVQGRLLASSAKSLLKFFRWEVETGSLYFVALIVLEHTV